jgi:hypothetical protein
MDSNTMAQLNMAKYTTHKRRLPPVDVKEVRRSRRIAGLNVGFKDKAAADKAHEAKDKSAKKCLSLEYEVEIIDPAAPPPPALPMGTIQALGTKQCRLILRIYLLRSFLPRIPNVGLPLYCHIWLLSWQPY